MRFVGFIHLGRKGPAVRVMGGHLASFLRNNFLRASPIGKIGCFRCKRIPSFLKTSVFKSKLMQWFSSFSMLQSYLEGLLKPRLLDPTSELLIW